MLPRMGARAMTTATQDNYQQPGSPRDHSPAQPSGWRGRIRKFAVRNWACLLQFSLVLWIVRVPLSTTIFGLLLLSLAPQAQDLFVEFTLKQRWELLPFLYVKPWWAIYFLLVLFLVWAMPTHYAARLLVDSDRGMKGALAAERNLKQRAPKQKHNAVCLECSAVWVPRILGLLTFVAVLIAIWRSRSNMPTLIQSEVTAPVHWALFEMALLVIASAIGFVVYVIKRPRSADVPVLRTIKRLNSKVSRFWNYVSPGRDPSAVDEEQARDVGRLLLLIIFGIFVAIFLLGAERVGMIFPRIMAVPFVLGGWLPFLSYLSGVGRQIRAPLIVGLVLAIAAFAIILGDNHSVRLITAGKDVDTKPLPLQDAVTQWRQENGCAKTAENATEIAPCPRPIIVAAEGGASRAGFFMASIIGYFLQPQETIKYGLDPNDVSKRLFAISSVSGGSMGAVMVTAALNAAKPGSDKLPCIRGSVDQWWGEDVQYWRDCFEALTSGDFLTADFLGFAFNDMLPFAWRDRAAVLEDSWNKRYREVITDPDPSGILCPSQDLDCPLLALRPTPGHWIPLLVLNGTSEATGGRILTTVLANTYRPQLGCPSAVSASDCPLFTEADRFHELLKGEAKPGRWLGLFERIFLDRGDDVRLSTAAHNSARFPLISPPGSIRNRKEKIVDRILDGGYFENYGALSARELAMAVHAVNSDLYPLVIVISNDPDDPLDPNDDAVSNQPNPPRPEADAVEPATDVTAPLTTFANARTAHGILSVDELRRTLHAAIPECHVLAIQVHVWPDQDKPLSMSWWESSLVQRQLHRQTEENVEKNLNGPHLQAIWQEMRSSSCAKPNKAN